MISQKQSPLVQDIDLHLCTVAKRNRGFYNVIIVVIWLMPLHSMLSRVISRFYLMSEAGTHPLLSAFTFSLFKRSLYLPFPFVFVLPVLYFVPFLLLTSGLTSGRRGYYSHRSHPVIALHLIAVGSFTLVSSYYTILLRSGRLQQAVWLNSLLYSSYTLYPVIAPWYVVWKYVRYTIRASNSLMLVTAQRLLEFNTTQGKPDPAILGTYVQHLTLYFGALKAKYFKDEKALLNMREFEKDVEDLLLSRPKPRRLKALKRLIVAVQEHFPLIPGPPVSPTTLESIWQHEPLPLLHTIDSSRLAHWIFSHIPEVLIANELITKLDPKVVALRATKAEPEPLDIDARLNWHLSRVLEYNDKTSQMILFVGWLIAASRFFHVFINAPSTFAFLESGRLQLSPMVFAIVEICAFLISYTIYIFWLQARVGRYGHSRTYVDPRLHYLVLFLNMIIRGIYFAFPEVWSHYRSEIWLISFVLSKAVVTLVVLIAILWIRKVIIVRYSDSLLSVSLFELLECFLQKKLSKQWKRKISRTVAQCKRFLKALKTKELRVSKIDKIAATEVKQYFEVLSTFLSKKVVARGVKITSPEYREQITHELQVLYMSVSTGEYGKAEHEIPDLRKLKSLFNQKKKMGFKEDVANRIVSWTISFIIILILMLIVDSLDPDLWGRIQKLAALWELLGR
jgi:hypothetical protein